MTVMLKVIFCVLTLLICGADLLAQSPDELRWSNFIRWNPGRARAPEDQEIGLLANMRNPDSSWAAALAVCGQVLDSVKKGEIPEQLFHPALRVPLSLEFQRVLAEGGIEPEARFGRPLRDGNRVSVPLRLDFPDSLMSSGYVYLQETDGQWFVDEWAVNLKPESDLVSEVVSENGTETVSGEIPDSAAGL